MKPDGLSASKLWASFPSSLELEMRIQLSKLASFFDSFCKEWALEKISIFKNYVSEYLNKTDLFTF